VQDETGALQHPAEVLDEQIACEKNGNDAEKASLDVHGINIEENLYYESTGQTHGAGLPHEIK
jgi:hypothetical protein